MKQNSVAFGQRNLNIVSFDTSYMILSGVCKVDICSYIYCLTLLTILVPEDKFLLNVFNFMPISFLAVKCKFCIVHLKLDDINPPFITLQHGLLIWFELRHSVQIKGELLLRDL